ncbi:B12-binding domain-containing radical SAM protein [Candidatus Poribacteria bacterium]|nr:B12-binding domain-containing radical SAM protein [Candidatus Poribacteria bacterium]
MKIVLFVPSWNYRELREIKNERLIKIPFIASQGVIPPTGILSIAACLKKAGHEVKIFDGYFHTDEEILKYIEKNSPHLVGIRVVSCLWDKTINLLKKIKVINNSIFTVIGGPHANLYLKSCLDECRDLDAVAWGEGEVIMPLLAEKLMKEEKSVNEISGLITRNNDIKSPALINEINNIPYPDIYLLSPDINSYIPNIGLYYKNPFAAVFTTRGCYMQCAFCYEGKLFNKVRKRSIHNILQELDYLINKYKIKTINFYDDLSIFNCDYDASFSLCEEIIKKKYNLKWSIYLTNFNIENKLLNIMKKAGCFRIHCVIESGYQKNRDYIRGNHYPLAKIKEKITEIKNEKIETYGRFMFGIFGETYNEGLKTIEYACSLDLDFASFIKSLLAPGTRMFNDLKQIGNINEDRRTWSYYGDFYKPYPMKKDEVDTLIKLAYYKFYFNKKQIRNIINKINSFEALEQYIYYTYRLIIDKL